MAPSRTRCIRCGVGLRPAPLAHAEVEFTYSGPALPIPDGTPAGVNVPMSVFGLNAITDLNFRMAPTGICDATLNDPEAPLAHTSVGDLVLKLTSPQGTTITLYDRRGGTRENICNLTLDDDSNFAALSTITSMAGSPVIGGFLPEQALSAFDGQNPTGQWVLNISDNAGNNTGILRRYALVLDTVPQIINVDVLDDPLPGACTPGSCSLREAVSLANVSPGPDRIVLPASVAIVLTRAGVGEDGNITGDLDITDDTIIEGAGSELTTLSQTTTDRLFHVIGSGVDFSLRNLRVQGGSGVADGGAVYMPNGGRLRVEGAVLTGHRAAEHGGAIFHTGGSTSSIVLSDSTFDDNRATNTIAENAYGGALYSLSSGFQDGYALIENSTFNNNRADNGGGALALDGVQSVSGNSGTIRGSIFTQNQVTQSGPGGAIGTNVEGNGLFELAIDNSIFQQNSTPSVGANDTGGAVAQRNGQGMFIVDSIFNQNSARSGGAFHGSMPQITDTTLCLNTAAEEGAALRLGAFDTTILRSTLCVNSVSSADTADFGGGAIAKPSGDLVIERSTLDGNSALRGAAIAFGGDDLRLSGNTIVAPSPLPGGALGSVLRYTNIDAGDSLVFFNNILIGQCSYSSVLNPDNAFNNIEASGNTCRLPSAAMQAGNQTAVAGSAINLATLAPNGGSTNTRLPVAPSIALNTGSNTSCTFLDQRGYQRTDAQCDIGSVEVDGAPPPDAVFANGYE